MIDRVSQQLIGLRRGGIPRAQNDDDQDSVRAIKGIALGCLLSVPFWLCVGLALRAVLT